MADSMFEDRKTKGAQTRKRIAESFIVLMRRKRWYNITVKEICTAATITRSTYYQYFDDIHDLMEQIQMSLLNDLQDRYRKAELLEQKNEKTLHRGIQADIYEDVNQAPRIFNAWFEFCGDNKAAMQALTDEENGDPYFRKRLKEIVIKHLDATMDQDSLPQDELRGYFHDLYFVLHIDAMNLWLSKSGDISAEKMAIVLNTMRAGAIHTMFEERRTHKKANCADKESGKVI